MDPPSGVSVAIKGIKSDAFGCSCYDHRFCGIVVDLDTVLRLKRCTVQQGKRIFVSSFLVPFHFFTDDHFYSFR